MSGAVRHGRWIALIAFAVGYAVLAHYTMVAGAETLGAAVALAPLVFAIGSGAWHARRRWPVPLAAVAGGAALVWAWAGIENHFNQLYWMEHAGTQLFLCLLFGRTLHAGREPMCSYFARVVHGSLTAPLARYTRKVTVAWTAFFGLMAATSTILFFSAPLATWSAFSNFLTAPLIGLMFIGEYLVRRHTQRHMDHVHILEGVKAFWKKPAD